MNESASIIALLSRAVVVGILGGAGLVLTQLYTRRGPLIFPVYAAILAVLGLVSFRFRDLSFPALFAAVLAGMLVATGCAFVAVLITGAKSRRELRASGRPMAEGSGAPWWGFPVIGLAIVLASAAVAYVIS
jgi:hypothetical protein